MKRLCLIFNASLVYVTELSKFYSVTKHLLEVANDNLFKFLAYPYESYAICNEYSSILNDFSHLENI